MSVADRIVEMAVVHPGDSVIVRVANNQPLDPYSSESTQSQIEGLASRLKDVLGEDVSVVVLAGAIEVTVLRAGETERPAVEVAVPR